MEPQTIQEISEIIQSSHINFLTGAGCSYPFLPLLGNIEKDLNEALNIADKEIKYKEYFSKVMLPNKDVLRGNLSTNTDFQKTKSNYIEFFQSLSQILLSRKSTLLSKQINIFTTNIDVLIETILEHLQMEYNDGFSGKFTPTFGLANYKKGIFQRSLHYEHISEIPLFNIIKIHGSLTWQKHKTDEKIMLSHRLDHLDANLLTKTGDQFSLGYKEILVVNPEIAKHLETVLTVYYSELLRLYSSELEKENSALFVIGFSMEDKHIREITLRAAKSNPTLRILIFCSLPSKSKMNAKLDCDYHPNIKVYCPENDTDKFTLDYLTTQVLKKVVLNKS